MSDDWRLQIDLHEESRAHALTEHLDAEQLEHDLSAAFHDRVIVSRDGARVFLYAGTREQAEAARSAVEADAQKHGWTLDVEFLGPAAPLPQRRRAQLGGFLRHIRSCLLYGDSTRRRQAVKGRIYLAARPRFAHPVRRLGALIGRDPTFCKRLFEQADCRSSILHRDPALSRRRTGREPRKTLVHKDLRDLIRRFGNFHGRANPQARFLIDMPHRLVHFETPVSILAIGIGRAKLPAFASATPCLQPFDSVKHRANTLLET